MSRGWKVCQHGPRDPHVTLTKTVVDIRERATVS